MIVRNEEATLARCLASAAPWVSEMLVVDTGSTDRTVAIAEELGARVVPFTWVDDFSAARNFALDEATREWALVLDADEELVVDDASAFADGLERASISAFAILRHDLLDDGSITVAPLLRLFRRTAPGMRYRGVVHEQVIAVADGVATPSRCDFAHMRHDGYLHAAMASKEKVQRNLALAGKLVAARPDDPFSWFCLGLSQPDAADATANFEQALARVEASASERIRGESYVLAMVLRLAQRYGQTGDPRLDDLLARGLADFAGSPDLHYARGVRRLAAGDVAGAALDFEACLSERGRTFFVREREECWGYGAQSYLGVCRTMQGRAADGEALLRDAVATSPASFALPRRWLAKVLGDRATKLMDDGRATEARALLKDQAAVHAGLGFGWSLLLTGDDGGAEAVWRAYLDAPDRAEDSDAETMRARALGLMRGLLTGSPATSEARAVAPCVPQLEAWFRWLVRHERWAVTAHVLTAGPSLGAAWPALRMQFAVVLVLAGRLDEGRALLEHAEHDGPEDAEIAYWLGYCALGAGRVDEARARWQRAAALAPGHRLATEGVRLLGKIG